MADEILHFKQGDWYTIVINKSKVHFWEQKPGSLQHKKTRPSSKGLHVIHLHWLPVSTGCQSYSCCGPISALLEDHHRANTGKTPWANLKGTGTRELSCPLLDQRPNDPQQPRRRSSCWQEVALQIGIPVVHEDLTVDLRTMFQTATVSFCSSLSLLAPISALSAMAPKASHRWK